MRRDIAFALAVGSARYAPTAAASYAQMTLPGLGAEILLALIALYALVIDVVLLCKGFRHRVCVIVGTAISLVLVIGLLIERADLEAAFDNLARDWQARLLGVAIVLVSLILLAAPLIQHLELRRQRPRRGVYVAIAVQAVLVAVAWTFTYFDDHPRDSTRAAWQELRARGEQVGPGGVAALRDAFEKQYDWGTFESWQLLKGIEHSALIHGGAPLPPGDRDALIALLERDRAAARPRAVAAHYYGFIETKLLWDTLEPGSVARRMPRGRLLKIEDMLEFIDRHGPQRLCSVDRLADADRAALLRAMTAGLEAEAVVRVTRSLDRLDEACRTAHAGSRR